MRTFTLCREEEIDAAKQQCLEVAEKLNALDTLFTKYGRSEQKILVNRMKTNLKWLQADVNKLKPWSNQFQMESIL